MPRFCVVWGMSSALAGGQHLPTRDACRTLPFHVRVPGSSRVNGHAKSVRLSGISWIFVGGIQGKVVGSGLAAVDVLQANVRGMPFLKQQSTYPLVGSDLASPRPYELRNDYHHKRRRTSVTPTFIKVRNRGERVEGTCEDNCSVRSSEVPVNENGHLPSQIVVPPRTAPARASKDARAEIIPTAELYTQRGLHFVRIVSEPCLNTQLRIIVRKHIGSRPNHTN